MKCTIPEISWHNRDPVLSIDIQAQIVENSKGRSVWRLATGGADSHVLIWHLAVNETGAASITCVADLERHQKAVNVVRFSPSGEFLATGDDESAIILWERKDDIRSPPSPPARDDLRKERWNSRKVLRGHLEDVYDLAWSPDSAFLVSGSVDNSAIVWDVDRGRSASVLRDYKGFVQGVSWDPCNRYICTLSTDRHCRLIDVNTSKTARRVHRAKIPTPPGHPLEGKTVRLFHDDTFKSFFRRLTFTIDGSLVIAPSGIIEPLESSERIANATIVFSTHNLKEPIMVLPSLDESTVAVRCCPIYFELREDGPVSVLALPYRMIFAVATQRSVIVYDTQQTAPIALVSNIHYTRLTDVAWSSDGRTLVVSSTDGYCSILHFQEGELGNVFKGRTVSRDTPFHGPSEFQEEQHRRTKNRDLVQESNDDATDDADTIEKNSRFDARESADVTLEESQDIKLVYNETNDADITDKDSRLTPPKGTSSRTLLSVKTPRRVELITISSPKRPKN